MSDLKDRLRSDLTQSIKARDEVRSSTIRMVLAAITNAEVAGKVARDLTDDDIVGVLATEAKKRREAATAFSDAGRTELAGRETVPLAELYAFPVIYLDAAYHPGLCRQMGVILQQRSLSPTIVGEARTLSGCLTRVAAGLGVAVADADHMQAVRRASVVITPLVENLHFTTYVLYKQRAGGPPGALQRFLTHATTPH